MQRSALCRSRRELSSAMSKRSSLSMYVIATVFCSNFHFSVSLHVPFSQFLFERDSYSNEYLFIYHLVFTCKIWRRYSRERASQSLPTFEHFAKSRKTWECLVNIVVFVFVFTYVFFFNFSNFFYLCLILWANFWQTLRGPFSAVSKPIFTSKY